MVYSSESKTKGTAATAKTLVFEPEAEPELEAEPEPEPESEAKVGKTKLERRNSDSGNEHTNSSLSSCSGEQRESSELDLEEHADEPEDDEDDCFEDANQELGAPEGPQAAPKRSGGDELRTRLQETRVVLSLALNNQFVRALEICSQSAHEELYASLASATLSFLRAALTLEQADLGSAVRAINTAFEVSSRGRKQTSVVARFLYKANYDAYSDEQCHAELVHAESLLLLALISFLADQSLLCLVRGAFRIRACYQRYRECLAMLASNRTWASEEARRHFESGVRMGHGVFNLLMSYLPRRVLRFLEYVGFSGNRSVGVGELEHSVALGDGLRSVFSALVILTYHSYIENLFGLGHYEPAKVERLSELLLRQYPDSAFFLLFKGRYHQMLGQLAEAISSFERCIEAQDDWRQFHSICHWEMMWCHAVQLDWKRAAHYAHLLRTSSKWSAASYTYQYASFLYAQLDDERRAGLVEAQSADYVERLSHISKTMASVAGLRIRYAGKTIPAEKFAIMRSLKFARQDSRLTLPALEFLYIWNIFVTLRHSPEQSERLLERCLAELDYIKRDMALAGVCLDQDQDSGKHQDQQEDSPSRPARGWIDELSVVLLLKGMCLKQLGRIAEAEGALTEVIQNEPKIGEDTFIVPHAAMELALIKLEQGELQESRACIKLARSHTGYLHETMVHFKLHAANRLIRLELQDKSLLSSASDSECVAK